MTASFGDFDGIASDDDGHAPGRGGRLADRLLRGAFVACLPVAGFLCGAILMAADLPPGPQVARAYEGGKALIDKAFTYHDPLQSDLWAPTRSPEAGVTLHDPQRAQQGYTLYTSGHEAAAYLVDMDGNVVHEWKRPFSTVWDKSAAVRDPQPDGFVYFRKAHLFPNGDLLAIYEGAGDTPYGYGMVKLDRDGNVLWRFLEHTHHDFAVASDGRIYVLTHEISDQPAERLGHLKPPRIEDFLVVLSAEGEELMRIPLLGTVARSRFEPLLHTVSFYALKDPLHTNTVKIVEPGLAAGFPRGKLGQVMLSFRELNAIAILDLEMQEIVWALRGPWLGQHDPDILPNGNILLFDNNGRFKHAAGRSRVLEIDPRNSEIVWQYAGTEAQPFESAIRSSQQRLVNGNTLITESDGGRLLEVTPEGDVVWEFRNPARAGKEGGKTAILCWGQRIDPAMLEPTTFAGWPRRTPTTSEVPS